MEIYVRDKCPVCDGCGMVQPGIWTEYFRLEKKIKEETGDYPASDHCEQWFRERGHWEFPAEEKTCHECSGSGGIEYWVSVWGFIKKLCSIK